MSTIGDHLDRLVASRPPRAKSLAVTVFGDVVVPHGGYVWIGSLIRWLAPFGVNGRAVRTAVYRLCSDGWFTSRSTGRKSDYTLTPLGRHNFSDAERRIYATGAPRWTGEWCLVILADAAEPARKALRWHGFGEVAPAVLVHPAADAAEVRLVLADLGLDGRAVVLTARRHPAVPVGAAALRDLVGGAWDLSDLAAEYAGYVDRFAPLRDALAKRPPPDPEVCFRVRVLAIHELRRILLRDPELPAELLPAAWVGGEARAVCRDVYRRVQTSATRYVLESGETSTGRLPQPAPFFFERFAGRRQSPRNLGSRFSRKARTPSR